jgi:hypothetical protein
MDQVETLQTAAGRTRALVEDERFEPAAEEALKVFGSDLQGHMGRADSSELFTPLEVWTGYEWEPGAFIGLQDRGVVAWGKTTPRSQVIPRAQVKHVVETDTRPEAITWWVDCPTPISLRVQRYAGSKDVPQAVYDALAPYAREAEAPEIDDRPDLVCPACGGAVREGADFCPHCGHPMTKAKGFNKLWLLGLIPVAVVAIVLAVLALGGDDKVKPPLAKATATASPGPSATATGLALPRRISGPGWRGRAPGSGWKIGSVSKQSGGNLLVRVLTGPGGAVIRIFQTPKENANPGTFRLGALKPLKTRAQSSSLATVRHFGTTECAKRNCSDLLLNDPSWGGLAITVNATGGSKLAMAKAIAASIRKR